MGSSRTRVYRRGYGSVLVLLALLSQEGRALQRARPASRRGFQVILWRHLGPPLSPEYAEAVKKAGITGVSVDQDEDPARVADLGLPFYIDHAAGKGILHLRQKDWQRCLEAYEKSRSVQDLVRPYPLLSGEVRGKLHDLVERRVKRARPRGPLMISLDDEISTTRLQNPFDFCFHESSLKAFRIWLAARYGKIEGLNRMWGRKYESFEKVLPPTTDEVRRRELLGSAWPVNLSDWNDHRSFMDQTLAQTVDDLCRRVRKLAPGVPVGFEGGQAPSTFGGFDYSLLLPVVDFIEPYDIAGTRELVRSLKRPGTLHFETIFPAIDPTVPDLPVARLYDALAHGLSGVIVWSSEDLFAGRRPDRLSDYGRRLAREFVRIRPEKGRMLADAGVSTGRIAILESQPSVRLHWMLDSAGDGQTWLRRFGSYERRHSSSQAARLSWVRLLQDVGYSFRFITPEQLARGRFGDGPRPLVLILPSALVLSNDEMKMVRDFAERGGLVLADESPGRYDEFLRLRKVPSLDRFFGLERGNSRRFLREGRLVKDAPRLPSGLGFVESRIAPDGLTVAQRHGRSWCQFERETGKGRAVLLNLAVAEYAAARLSPDKVRLCRDLRRRVWRLLENAGLLPIALARVEKYPTVLERIVLGRGRKKVLVIRANCLESPRLFRELVDRGPQPLTIQLPVAAKVTDLWTGEEVSRGREIRAVLDPLRGSFFIVEAL